MPVEHMASKSAGDEHAAAGEPLWLVSTGTFPESHIEDLPHKRYVSSR
jgi:hypothetical protein